MVKANFQLDIIKLTNNFIHIKAILLIAKQFIVDIADYTIKRLKILILLKDKCLFISFHKFINYLHKFINYFDKFIRYFVKFINYYCDYSCSFHSSINELLQNQKAFSQSLATHSLHFHIAFYAHWLILSCFYYN